MSCPNCGHEARGKFCTSCGARVAGDSAPAVSSDYGAVWPDPQLLQQPIESSPRLVDPAATTTLLRADLEEYAARLSASPVVDIPSAASSTTSWLNRRELAASRTHVTKHFRIHYSPGSLAEQALAMIAGRLENVRTVASDLLGLAPPAACIDVYLSESLMDDRGNQFVTGGYAVPDRAQIFEVYRAESPGESLERSLLLVMLALVVGKDRVRFPLIVDGLHAQVMQRLGGFPPDGQVVSALAAAKERGELPSIPTLLEGPTPDTQETYYLAASNFVGFLIRTYGAERFIHFVGVLDADRPAEAARAVYGKTVTRLDRAWRKTLEIGTAGGVVRFLRLSSAYLRPYWLKVAEILIYLALSVAFGIGLAKMQGTLLDKALLPRDRHALAAIMGVLVGAFIVVSLTSLRQSYLTAYVSESILREMRLRIFALIQRLHPGFFQTMETGDIMSRMTSDLAAIEFALTAALVQGLRLLLMLLAALATIFLLNWKLAAIAMAGTPLFFLTSHFIGPPAARASKERQENLARATSTLQENLGAQAVVKAFGLQERMIGTFARDLDKVFRSSLRLTYLSGIFGLSSNSIASAIQLTVLGVGAWLIIGHDLTIGTLFAFLALMAQIIAPIQSISGILQALQQASGSMDRVDELLKAEPAIEDVPDARPLERLSGALRLEGVSFGYVDGQAALTDLDLEIPAGSRVALVGPSGCGKSSVLNLIMRFYDPQRGRLTLDGVDVREATLDSLREQMGVVFQDNLLFNISIRENIRLGYLQATDAQVEAAARAAELDELIADLPEGYDTVVGERGGRLSGGQRQRVAIARAIIRDPAILLLDEATSALDPRTEAAINDTLERIGSGRTTITVTHRLSSVVKSDRIYVLDGGKLVEQGTHHTLMNRGGLYAQLWQEQGDNSLDAGVRSVPTPSSGSTPLLRAL